MHSPRRDAAHRSGQQSLFDAPRPIAPETRAAAFVASKPKQSDRIATALACLRRAGSQGLTRHELAEAMPLPLQSVCSIALRLRRDGLAVESGKRPTPTGSMAAVLIASSLQGGQHNGR